MNIDGYTSPEFLIIGCILLLVFFGVLFWWNAQQNFWEMSLLRQVYKHESWWWRVFLLSAWMIFLGYAMLFAGPYHDVQTETVKKNGVDIEIVLDVSYSMIADDIAPSRIAVAKTMLQKLVGELDNDRVWVIFFSGKPFSSSPLTYDYTFIKQLLENVWVETIDQRLQNLQWTAIGDGLLLAADTLSQDDSHREKIIILLTDGEANRGIDPKMALKLLKSQDIKTYTIWVGKDEETMINIIDTYGNIQKILVGWIDEPLLQKIAQETGWKYFRADSAESFAQIVDTIAQLEKKPLETEVYSLKYPAIKMILLCMFLCFWVFGYIIFFKHIRI